MSQWHIICIYKDNTSWWTKDIPPSIHAEVNILFYSYLFLGTQTDHITGLALEYFSMIFNLQMLWIQVAGRMIEPDLVYQRKNRTKIRSGRLCEEMRKKKIKEIRDGPYGGELEMRDRIKRLIVLILR